MKDKLINQSTVNSKDNIYLLFGGGVKNILFRPVFILTVIYTIFFCLIPIIIYYSGGANDYLVHLAAVSFVSTTSVVIGYAISVKLGYLKFLKITISPVFYFKFFSTTFLIYVCYAFYSFGGIPLISVLSGTIDPDVIRGEFFKGREGIDQVVVYIGALLIYIFVPFSILIAYDYKIKGRFLFFTFSLLYCVLTLQKALLLNLLIPTLYYLFVTGRVGFFKMLVFFLALFIYFILAINVSGHAELDGTEFSLVSFFSANYIPSGALDYFVWRSLAVPVYTSVDTLVVFDQWLNNQYLMGGSSSLLSALFGVERINIEKIVFEYQFGGFNFFANANAYFAVGLFTDFGYIGLIVLSIFLGMGFGMVDKAKTVALYSMSFLLVYLLFNASLIGTLLSSGYLYLFLHAFFIKFKELK